MRPGQNRRMRGRSRNKGPNPLTRTFESNGPDVKIRGTAQHVADKYAQLARDAQASGDPVSAENYLQHAEHYYRLIAAAQEQFRQQFGGFQRPYDEEGEEGDEDGGGYGPVGERHPGAGGAEDYGEGPNGYDPRGGDRPMGGRFDRGGERIERGDRADRGDRNNERGDRNDRGNRPAAGRFDRGDRQAGNERHPGNERRGDGEPRRAEGGERFDRQNGERFDRPERAERHAGGGERSERPNGARPERGERRERFVNGERPENGSAERAPRPERGAYRPEGRFGAPEDEAEAGLPAFLMNPIRQQPAETGEAVERDEPEAIGPARASAAETDPEASEARAPRRRRRKAEPTVDEAGGTGAGGADTTE